MHCHLDFAGLLYTIQTDLHNYFVSNRFSAATFAVYSIGVAQLPLVGILRESVSSVILPRISYLQEQGQAREIRRCCWRTLFVSLPSVYLPIYAFLMVTGREFLTLMFTSAYAGKLAHICDQFDIASTFAIGSGCSSSRPTKAIVSFFSSCK